ncbi:crossover junction endodeoxyribonuclease RuvC [Candidatus Jorgensenbacteria bacterium]|nr:crossover junction endodeoxyribonuclease RuvC [Candidatus Jorgensenbacteria bacterium]
MVILGIDPGTTRVGYGVIKKSGPTISYIDAGLLDIPKAAPKTTKLVILDREINDLLDRFSPARVGIERIFFSKNQKTALDVAEARGVIMTSIVKKSIPMLEFTPSSVKAALTGDGRASKTGVAKIVSYILKRDVGLIDDVTDALAIAIVTSNEPWN